MLANSSWAWSLHWSVWPVYLKQLIFPLPVGIKGKSLPVQWWGFGSFHMSLLRFHLIGIRVGLFHVVNVSMILHAHQLCGF